jgi:hypothetical protein
MGVNASDVGDVAACGSARSSAYHHLYFQEDPKGHRRLERVGEKRPCPLPWCNIFSELTRYSENDPGRIRRKPENDTCNYDKCPRGGDIVYDEQTNLDRDKNQCVGNHSALRESLCDSQ